MCRNVTPDIERCGASALGNIFTAHEDPHGASYTY